MLSSPDSVPWSSWPPPRSSRVPPLFSVSQFPSAGSCPLTVCSPIRIPCAGCLLSINAPLRRPLYHPLSPSFCFSSSTYLRFLGASRYNGLIPLGCSSSSGSCRLRTCRRNRSSESGLCQSLASSKYYLRSSKACCFSSGVALSVIPRVSRILNRWTLTIEVSHRVTVPSRHVYQVSLLSHFQNSTRPFCIFKDIIFQ